MHACHHFSYVAVALVHGNSELLFLCVCSSELRVASPAPARAFVPARWLSSSCLLHAKVVGALALAIVCHEALLGKL